MNTQSHISIYAPDDSLLLNVLVTKECLYRASLMKEDSVELSWASDSSDILPVGSYITYNGERYTLYEAYEPEQKDEAQYLYNPVFQSVVFGRWCKTPLFFYTYAEDGTTIVSREPDWSLTDSAEVFMDYVVKVLKAETGEDWKYATASDLGGYKSIKFRNTDIISALNAIADEWDTEWYADKQTHTLRLGKAMFGEDKDIVLSVGENVKVPNITLNKEGYFNRFYVFGSSRNITQDYNGANVNNIVNRRLTLDPTKYPDGYIDIRKSKDEPVLIKTLFFDEIYPKSSLVVAEARPRIMFTLDNEGNKLQIGTTAEGEPIYDTYSIWYIQLKDSVTGQPYRLSNTDTYSKENPDGVLISGKTLSVHFSSGSLLGREFELAYHDKRESIVNSDGTPFEVKIGDFEILFTKDGDYVIPAMTGLVPAEGDSAILFNLRMPAEYINGAYKELEEAAEKRIGQYKSDRNNYRFDSNPVAFHDSETLQQLHVGQAVTYRNGGYEYQTRIIAIERKIDFPFEQNITVGNEQIKGTRQTLEETVANANNDINLIASFNQLAQTTLDAYNRAMQTMLDGFARIGRMWQFDDEREDTIFSKYHVYSMGEITAMGPDDGSTGGDGGQQPGTPTLTTIGALSNVTADADNIQATDMVLVKEAGSSLWTLRSLSTIGGQGGLDLAQLDEYLAGKDYAHKGDIPSLAGYAREDWVKELLKGYASTEYVNQKVAEALTGGQVDLSGYLTKTEAQQTYQPKGSYLTSHQSIYALTLESGQFSAVTYNPKSGAKTVKIPTLTSHLTNDLGFITSEALTGYAKMSDIPSLEGYAKETWVTAKGYITSAALNGYATEIWVEGKGYLTQHQSLADYPTRDEVSRQIVEAVTGGKVDLTGYATEKWVTEQGYLKQHQSLADYLTKADAADMFQLKGDYLTSSALTDYAKKSDIPSLSDYVTLSTAQTINGVKTFYNGFALRTDTSWTNSDRSIPFSANNNPSLIQWYWADDNKGLTFNPNTGALKAASFVRRGGTSAQFLKADGSVDSNVYITSSALNGYATEAWVEGLGYATTSQLSNYLSLNGGTMNTTDVVKNLNADMLDGYHEESFLRYRGRLTSATEVIGGVGLYGWTNNSEGFSTSYGNSLILQGYSTWYDRLDFNTNGQIDHWHCINGSVMTKVGTIALTSSNVASATRLQGSYSLWGQMFYGNNVSGDMTDVGNITPKANATYNNGSLANCWINVYTNRVRSNTTLYLHSLADTSMIFLLGDTEVARFLKTTGYFGIGTPTPTHNLHVVGSFYASGATTLASTLTVSGAATFASTLKIGEATLSWDATNKALKTDTSFYSEKEIAALGAASISGGTSGGGTSYDRLDTWSSYSPTMSGWVLSAGLGYDLYTTLTALSSRVSSLEGSAGQGGGLDESQLAQYLTSNNYAKKSDIPSLDEYMKTSTANASFVTALNTSGNYLTWSKNGTTNNITVPYATSALQLNRTVIDDPSNAYELGKVKWFNAYSTITASKGYAGNNTGFPVSNDANGILWLGTHSSSYGGQIGVSSDGNLYYRFISNNNFPTTADGGSWKKLAFTSDIPSLDDYAKTADIQSWVTGKGYITSSALNGYATQSWVSGAFAVKNQSAEVDLDTLSDSGILRCAADATATPERNYPIKQAGIVIYGLSAHNRTNQIYGSYNSNRWFARSAGTSEMKPWREFAFIDNLPTDVSQLNNDIGYITLSSLTWNNITGKPTTLGGYGITDAYTKTETTTVLSQYLTDNGYAKKSDIPSLAEYMKTSTANATFVTALGVSGNNLTWTKNGTVNSITVPYATNADTLDGYHRSDLYATSYDWLTATDSTQSITVDGDKDTYYPVVITVSNDKRLPTRISIWKNLGSKTPDIQGNHSNGTSSMWLQYEMRQTLWDGNGGYCRVLYRSMPYASLCAHTRVNNSVNGALIVWLRGGGCLYNITCTNTFTATVYYTESNITGNSSTLDMCGPMTETDNLGLYNKSVPSDLPIVGHLVGTADIAARLETARTFWGQSFNGTQNVSGNITGTYFKINDSTNNPYLQLTQGSVWYIQGYNGYLYLGAGSTKSLRVDSNGNVNIPGATTLASTLTVSGAATFASTVKIGEATLSWDATNKALKTDTSFYSDKEIAALGAASISGGTSGGGTSYDRLDTWSSYSPTMSGWVLSAGLGYDLYTTLTALSSRVSSLEGSAGQGGGLDESQLAQYLTSNNYAKKSDIPSLTGYATESWVTGKGYITSSALNGYATQTWVEGKKYLTAHQSLAGYATEAWVEGKGYLTSSALNDYATTSQLASYVKKSGDTMTGSLTVPSITIKGTANAESLITSDSVYNIYFKVNNKSGLVINGDENCLRAGQSYNNVFSLGTSAVRWSNVYATTINVTSTSVVSNLNADLLDGQHASAFLGANATAVSATQLANTRTFWGQSFNGTQNVSGNITGTYFKINDSTNNPYLQLTQGSTWYIQGYNGYLYLGAGSAKSMRIDSNGNVNILGNINNVIESISGTSNARLYFASVAADSDYIHIYASGGSKTRNIVFQNGYGNVGIDTPTPSYKLHVVGNIYATGEITAGSDMRLKSDISTLKYRGSVRPVEFFKEGRRSIGFIAQEVKELYPELIFEDCNTGYLSMNYGGYTAVLQAQLDSHAVEMKTMKEILDSNTNDVKQLKIRITQQSQRITELENELATLRNR